MLVKGEIGHMCFDISIMGSISRTCAGDLGLKMVWVVIFQLYHGPGVICIQEHVNSEFWILPLPGFLVGGWDNFWSGSPSQLHKGVREWLILCSKLGSLLGLNASCIFWYFQFSVWVNQTSLPWSVKKFSLLFIPNGSSGKRHFTEVFLPNYRITVSYEHSIQLV